MRMARSVLFSAKQTFAFALWVPLASYPPFVARACCWLLAIGAVELDHTAYAGYVVLIGDGTPTFALAYDLPSPVEGTRRFFRNLLGSGDAVATLDIPANANTEHVYKFFSAIDGVSVSSLTGEITDDALSDIDLVVASRLSRKLLSVEAAAISRLLGRGGNLLVVVEPPPDAVRETIHDLFDKLDVELRLVRSVTEGAVPPATGDQIVSHPLTVGVTEFKYGMGSPVQGGHPLFLTTSGQPFAAAVFIPEPRTSALLVAGLVALHVFQGKTRGRKRRRDDRRIC